jgi:catechol 2,3-dioxygenase-like lactoylglutathione lyase family enzyme
MPEFHFHHGGVSVPDLDAALQWYRTVLGFELERRFPIPPIPAEVAIIRNGSLRMELFQPLADITPLDDRRRLPDSDARLHGNKHVAFSVRDVDEMGATLRARNADIVWIRRMPHGANIFIRDLAGNLIEFVEEPAPESHGGMI